MLNPYETLGVSQNATTEEIEAGYQNMLALHHDELVADPKGVLWSSLESSRSLLMDPKKRETQDNILALIAAIPQKAPAKKTSPQLESTEVSSLPPQRVPMQQASFEPTENITPVLPPQPTYKQSTQPTPQSVPKAPEVSHSPTVETNEENLLRNVKKPIINWQDMNWFNRDYSRLHENIKTLQPGLKKGFSGTVAFFLSVFLIAIYAGTYELAWANGWPVNMVFAIVAGITWVNYFKSKWRNKKKYFIAMGLFTAFSVYSILVGEHEGSSVVIAVIVGIISLATTYFGLPAADTLKRWLNIAQSRQNIRKNLSAKEIRNTMSWGEAGNLDDALDKFGAQAVALGSAGERFTAEFMQELLKIPGTRIFHGLKFPGSIEADVDHAIINGDKIVFVDSKMWKAGHYRWQWDGVIERAEDDGENPINSSFHTAVLGYRRMLPEAQMRSHILIYSGSGRPVTVDNSNAEKPYTSDSPVTELIAAQEFFQQVGDWFSEGTPGYVNKKLVSALYSNLKV